MKLRFAVASAAFAVVALAAVGAQAATSITGLFNTGVDGSGAPLAEGAADSHWLVNGASTPFVYDNAAYLVPSDARFIAV